MLRLTEEAHRLIAEVLRPGDVAIDATAGNGHDARFLAQCVGAAGTLYAFDLQSDAIDRTRARLADIDCQLFLIQADHADLLSFLQSQHAGRVAAAMFNLGYLPGGNKQIVTHTKSSLAAIGAAISTLRPGGILTVLAYPGHPGGAEETRSVADFLQSLDSQSFHFEEIVSHSERDDTPRLFVVRKSVA